MAAGLTRDIKRQVVKPLFDSGCGNGRGNEYKCVAIHLSVAAAC